MSIVSLILADNINMIEIKTSDCDDCGMGTFGELRMQVCTEVFLRGAYSWLFNVTFHEKEVKQIKEIFKLFCYSNRLVKLWVKWTFS